MDQHYRDFIVYEEPAMPGMYRTTMDEGQSIRNIYRSIKDAKAAIDAHYQKAESSRKYHDKLRREREEEQVLEKLSQERRYENAVKKVNKMNLKNKPLDTIITVYYRDDKGQHGIQIQRIRGKRFWYKHGRKKAVVIFYSDLVNRLVNIAYKYDTGVWS